MAFSLIIISATMLGALKGVTYVVLLVCGAFSGLLLFTPALVLMAVHSKTVIAYRRKWIEFISGIYFDYCAAVLMLLMNVKVHVYAESDVFLADRGPLVLCNHRTRVDWMFAGWCYAALVCEMHGADGRGSWLALARVLCVSAVSNHLLSVPSSPPPTSPSGGHESRLTSRFTHKEPFPPDSPLVSPIRRA